MNVLLLVILLWPVVDVHSQTAPYVSFMGETLPNHAFVDLSLVGTADNGSDSVQCHTDLDTCCSSIQGPDRGDWYFPSGDRLDFPDFSAVNVVYESRAGQRVDLLRKGDADMPSGVYRCDIETNAVHSDDNTDKTTRETVYAGLYSTGGKLTVLPLIKTPIINIIFAGWTVAYHENKPGLISLCLHVESQ